MLRREAIAMLAGAGACARAAPANLIGGDIPGAALLIDVPSRRLLAVHASDLAGKLLVPPGSAIKPFTIEALLASGKLRDTDTFPCPRSLEIGGRAFNCSHPPLAAPVEATTALAYSCNCFVAHFAERLAPGEAASYLTRWGLASRSGLLGDEEVPGTIRRAGNRETIQLQAIGENGVLVTAAGMAMAYRRLAMSATDAVRAGLEGAVEFGTAQQARVTGTRVAGKTGSVRAADGNTIAWFCGFAPSRSPSVAIAVVLHGRSGGADAAPVAGRILAEHLAGKL